MTGSAAVLRTTAEQAWSVTVVIPAADAESSLGATLDALTTLDVPRGGSYEIVVSDDGSTDGTIGVASRYQQKVRVLQGAWCGPSGARNRGAATATGDVLAFVDSGDVPFDGWLRQIVETFRDPSVGLASWPAWLVDEAGDRERLQQPGPGATGVTALATCFAMRRRVFNAVGGYDPALRCGENSDLCERAAAQCVNEGHRIVRAEQPAARVTLGRAPGYYDRARLDAAEHLLVRDAEHLATNPSKRVQLSAIAAVNAARCGEWSRARAHAWSALRRGRGPRDLARFIVTLIPPLARTLWAAEDRRSRIGLL
jgi:hypothetical protein